MRSIPQLALLVALLASGVACIINQVVWQRALKIYLAGSEAVSSMIVVLVFMLGIGIGSWIAGRVAGRLKNPLCVLGLIELALAGFNALVCVLLSLDLHHSVYVLQRLALGNGVWLQGLYAAISAILLALPCTMMGMTVPLASEASQRQLHQEEFRFLSRLFFLNTLGAVLGALAGSIVLLPILGQRKTLWFAIALNALAGFVALAASAVVSTKVRTYPATRREHESTTPLPVSTYRPELSAGFLLGFISLAFEMYLYRLAALALTPLPYTFAIVLTGFLLVWSAGVHFGGQWNRNIALWLSVASALLLMTIPMYILARWGCTDGAAGLILRLMLLAACFAPCFPFGILFTQMVSSYVKLWGKDVGRYLAFNTFGSCLGIVFATLVGFEFRSEYGLWMFASTTAVLAIYFFRRERHQGSPVQTGRLVGIFLSLSIVILLFEFGIWKWNDGSFESGRIVSAFYGRGGVVEIDRDNNLAWDGLWHSRLSLNDDHIGTNNWYMAAIPLLSHPRTTLELETCVIGLGTGITASTLARSNAVAHVDVYEINEKVREILREFPDGTLDSGTNSKIEIFWRDGRTGLALSEKRYDLITQQPLYLKQAGSSILLSREHMELVRSRLNNAGIFCIYCNAGGNVQQAAMVRRTARSVFRYCETFGDGYMIVASDTSIHWGNDSMRARLKVDPQLLHECESVGIDYLFKYKDSNSLSWESPFLITDDHPLVEYPQLIRLLVRWRS